MKKRIGLFALFMALAALLGACVQSSGTGVDTQRALSDMQRLYRDASLVVIAQCEQTHTNAQGEPCCDVNVERTLAGSSARVGDRIHCANSPMKEGEKYLLYLGTGKDAYQSEDSDGYTLLSEAPLKLSGDDTVELSNGSLSLSAIEEGIEEANSVISAQSVSYYYKNISTLSTGSDYIFIGRIADIPPLEQTAFRSNENGASVENTLPASIINVEVYGSIKGSLNYGQRIELVYCPAMNGDVIDAATLKPVTYSQNKVPLPQQDGVYLFFLLAGPDGKQDYYFGVNPIQFCAQLDKNDAISADYANRALSGYHSLELVVETIRKVLNG